ncbi:rCG58762 [Rattus norvegicus]|uniref:RCG58762 n=1 Tax=Rattus norvegicus TaxID=10116 RepID=A6JL22_RAT|nr:rCG58762 [Rattus norvegicus]
MFTRINTEFKEWTMVRCREQEKKRLARTLRSAK